jgi:membrane associated rhomboid family serine protease
MIPIKDTVPRRTFPFVTIAIIFTNGVIFLFETALSPQQIESFVQVFGLIPARSTHFPSTELFAAQYWPFFTNMFLHGSWLHVIGNMWSLYIFGDNVEDLLGPVRFFAFYLLAGVVANLSHFFVNSESTMPVIGASGAVAGIMAGYLRLFPRARVIVLFPILFLPYFFEVPAMLFMGIWFFSQVASGAVTLLASPEGGGIAWWAHIGGFALGFLLIRPLCSKRLGGCHTDELYHYIFR